MRDEAEKRIGHLYPMVEVTTDMVDERPDLKPLLGQKLKVIAWLWARTVKSPNPAFSHVDVPLASTFILSSKVGKEAYVEPVIDGDSYRFTVKVGKPPEEAKGGTKASGRGANFRCVLSNAPVGGDYIKAQGQMGRLGSRLMAVVAEGVRGRIYLSPSIEHEVIASSVEPPEWKPVGDVPARLTGGTCVPYGMKEWGDLFTPRQLVALTTFSDLVGEAIAKVKADALAAGMPDDGRGLDAGGDGASAYAEAVGVYLAFAVTKMADRGSSICGWDNTRDSLRNTFGRQAIPMVWDFAESSPIGDAGGSFLNALDQIGRVIADTLRTSGTGRSVQRSAQNQEISTRKVISTDPPYYDNIGYADLSDFFYVWLRRALKAVYPSVFGTLAVPKSDELVATPYRHGGKAEAEHFFLSGMTDAMRNLAETAHPAFPVTIYYAFKQSETKGDSGTSSTGWETFLEAVLSAGFALTGTWPMRTELSNRMISSGTNALASSIVLVCRRRSLDAPVASRREFIRELNAVLPEALAEMTRGGENSPVAPVDLSQAIIGPGMAIFSRYSAVLEADGTPMSVRTALRLINGFFAEEDFDHDTQFCLQWFEQHGWSTGKYGDADVLARAKGTSVGGLQESGVVDSSKGDLRLVKWAEMPRDWSQEHDVRMPVWEALHQLIRALNQDGESAAGALIARMPAQIESIRALAYRLYTLCERKGWADDARAYNELVSAWGAIEQVAADAGPIGVQGHLEF